ncbi:MAG: alanine racemase [Gammaproteobacteria bacterium]|nr:alanine racemase [Gammaproteobacteria bacterium]
MTRPARVTIDLAALQHNFSRVKEIAPGRKIMAVVKADAYGHGLARVARSLNSADAFGVACLEEAEELRAAGIDNRIVLLEGPYSAEELLRADFLNLDVVIHHESQLDMLEQVTLKKALQVWLKVDTGMHRLGFEPDRISKVWQRLQTSSNIDKDIVLMTHLATANELQNDMVTRQLENFSAITKAINAEKSIANSAAIVGYPQSHADWLRPGLMLYGVSPQLNCSASDHDLKPVMSLRSELISVKALKKGEPVGYGADWRCPSDTRIGIVAAGYGDGFPRHARSGTPALVNGKRASIIGKSSMDMLTVDLSAQAEAKVGDPVELWGANLAIEEVAMYAETIPYELLCGVHKRLTFEEING